SIFIGGFTLEAVATICGEQGEQEPDTFALLSSLLDHSLLEQEKSDADDPRYVLLESVQEYALERLREHAEMEACQRAHALYYLALVEKAFPHLIGAQQTSWLAQLNLEIDNLRAALLWLFNNNEVELALR